MNVTYLLGETVKFNLKYICVEDVNIINNSRGKMHERRTKYKPILKILNAHLLIYKNVAIFLELKNRKIQRKVAPA